MLKMWNNIPRRLSTLNTADIRNRTPGTGVRRSNMFASRKEYLVAVFHSTTYTSKPKEFDTMEEAYAFMDSLVDDGTVEVWDATGKCVAIRLNGGLCIKKHNPQAKSHFCADGTPLSREGQ